VALSVEDSYLMVQSSECQTGVCLQNNHTGFNSSLSSTFQPEYPHFQIHFGMVYWQGFYAKDTVSFAGQTLPKFPILFAETVEWEDWFHFNWYFDYDAVLGLAPDSVAWKALKESGSIEKSIMGLKFPSGPLDYDTIGERDDGELTLGGIDPEFENATFIDLPLYFPDSAGLWGTKSSYLTYDNKTHLIHEDLLSWSIVAFTSAHLLIILPGKWATRLMSQVYPYMTGTVVGRPAFPCEKRSELANLHINVGEGDRVYNLTLSGYDYTLRYIFEKEEVCFIAISQAQTDVIGLGWTYLRNFYTVFDKENARIRRKFHYFPTTFISKYSLSLQLHRRWTSFKCGVQSGKSYCNR
jgi:hypothetical protein